METNKKIVMELMDKYMKEGSVISATWGFTKDWDMSAERIYENGAYTKTFLEGGDYISTWSNTKVVIELNTSMKGVTSELILDMDRYGLIDAEMVIRTEDVRKIGTPYLGNVEIPTTNFGIPTHNSKLTTHNNQSNGLQATTEIQNYVNNLSEEQKKEISNQISKQVLESLRNQIGLGNGRE